MMIIMLTWRNWLEDVRVMRYTNLDSAVRHTESTAPDGTSLVFDTDASDPWAALRSYDTLSLLQMFNELHYNVDPKCHKALRREDAVMTIGNRLIAIARSRFSELKG